MSANDPGLAQVGAPAVDPLKGDVEKDATGDIVETSERTVAPDQFDEKYETSRWEIWSYYAYYIGNNGLVSLARSPTPEID